MTLKNELLAYYRNQLGEAEKPIWNEAYSLFTELMDDLKSKNLLRKGTLHMDRERLALIWENSRNYSAALNVMVSKFDSEKTLKEFASKSGLTLDTITYIFLSQLLATSLIDFESVLKTSLLFFLEEENGIRSTMTLGQLLRKIRKISPQLGNRLIEMINTKIRNSLAHGSFWFKRGGMVYLASNSHLDEVEEMELFQLWIETKRINIIAHAFTCVLSEKIDEGYFRL